MRIFNIGPNGIAESSSLPQKLPDTGFVWVACARTEFEARLAELQTTLQALTGLQLLDLHIADLLNNFLPSHYDFTSQYDVLVFRRLAAGTAETKSLPTTRGGPPILKRIDTSPVGFAVFDRVLLTVHPADCAVRDAYAAKLLASAVVESSTAGARLPTSPADLMMRVVNQMVDGFLELRRELTHQLDHWETELINPRTRFSNWRSLLDARRSLHHLDEICAGLDRGAENLA
jgi:Mg2+ and Co2+ transporter CorA